MLVIGLAACTLPTNSIQDIGSIYQTLVLTATPEKPSEDEKRATATATAGVRVITAEQSGEYEAAGLPCNRAAAGQPLDVTINDGSRFRPGDSFIKTWRLVNAGSCTWTEDYALVWFSGTLLALSQTVNLGRQVEPGKSIDVSLDMTAPALPGLYQSNWKLASASGDLFGIGPEGDAPFWARIEVIAVASPTPLQAATRTPTPASLGAGVFTLLAEKRVNLENGELGQSDEDDLTFVYDASEKALLQTLNGARLAVFGRNRPELEGCRALRAYRAALEVDALEDGLHLCYYTNQGRLGRLRLVEIDMDNRLLVLEFLTWPAP